MRLYLHEMKMNQKTLFIWTVSVGILCTGCILLFSSLEDSMQEVAASYSQMGAMSTALGLDKLSIATMMGFYATEIALMHGLGGAMFAAMLGTGIMAKEEAGHTAEFLNVLPLSRTRILIQKYLALVSNVIIFNIICVLLYGGAILILGEELPIGEFVLYHLSQVLMQIEIGTICFFISACSDKVKNGAGLGIAVILFAADMMCRIIPAIENLKYITPFYYANAADIFTTGEIPLELPAIGIGILAVALAGSVAVYRNRDLTA